jgi:hypothetical protein
MLLARRSLSLRSSPLSSCITTSTGRALGHVGVLSADTCFGYTTRLFGREGSGLLCAACVTVAGTSWAGACIVRSSWLSVVSRPVWASRSSELGHRSHVGQSSARCSGHRTCGVFDTQHPTTR